MLTLLGLARIRTLRPGHYPLPIPSQRIFPTVVTPRHLMYMTFPLWDSLLLIGCTLVAHWLLIGCSFTAHWLLSDCSLTAHRLLRGCSLTDQLIMVIPYCKSNAIRCFTSTQLNTGLSLCSSSSQYHEQLYCIVRLFLRSFVCSFFHSFVDSFRPFLRMQIDECVVYFGAWSNLRSPVAVVAPRCLHLLV